MPQLPLVNPIENQHRRSSSVNFGGHDIFSPKYVWKINKIPKFYMIFVRSARILHNNCPKIFFSNWGGGACPPCPRLLRLWKLVALVNSWTMAELLRLKTFSKWFWPWSLTLISGKLTVMLGIHAQHLCQISCKKSDLYTFPEITTSVINQQTNERMNQQTCPMTISPI